MNAISVLSNQRWCESTSFSLVNTSWCRSFLSPEWSWSKSEVVALQVTEQRCGDARTALYVTLYRESFGKSTQRSNSATLRETRLQANPQSRATLQTPSEACWELQTLSCPAPQHTLQSQTYITALTSVSKHQWWKKDSDPTFKYQYTIKMLQ